MDFVQSFKTEMHVERRMDCVGKLRISRCCRKGITQGEKMTRGY